MNRLAVPNAVRLVGASKEGPEGPEVSAGHHEKCIQQFALSAVLTLWFPFRPRGDRPVYCSDCFSSMRR